MSAARATSNFVFQGRSSLFDCLVACYVRALGHPAFCMSSHGSASPTRRGRHRRPGPTAAASRAPPLPAPHKLRTDIAQDEDRASQQPRHLGPVLKVKILKIAVGVTVRATPAGGRRREADEMRAGAESGRADEKHPESASM